ncbi:caspase recruitment domain-containing protein 8-like [Tympanuchus pallidicinctus]|uniref:caspase recruitment domain-containing protein 8-like n=1 Tax=Tympanuchus pallidicinctus TaxID=109042 RepID=UPI002287134E|nr:caspase recruitment domain-containing protein 8-like [Tympanuchus pallidicinctus]XP_052545464.1 caspase recruitment domain-containing protein 8-like [Tympanuchus pallidicinctus]XP_052545465.1 caspase recruitment domain-containing protein 8-like [Tympanuchus pallidicinctus]XP_052545466.1 caspase recruitment domain-containing protein 8-like [Tympanuchus pallidicinctus]
MAERDKAKMAETTLSSTTLSSTFSICVKSLLGNIVSVPVSLDDTVLDLKMKLFALDSYFYPSQARLIHGGWQLNDELTLRHYNITSNSIVHHVLRLRGGGSAPLEGKEDVSATGDQEPEVQQQGGLPGIASRIEAQSGSAGVSSIIEMKTSLSGITSTGAEGIQKWPQSDVPAEERSCLCVRQEFQELRPEIYPYILEEQNVYKACLPGPGIFQCSETGLAFEVESAASIVYRYASWSTHLKEADQNVWVPAGPLFNIWALPGTVRAVYLPHFICLSEVDISGCSIAHFEFQKMIIQQPTEVMAFSAVLQYPSFSLLGVVWRKLRSAISLPMHSLVLIFQQLSAANTTLHLYLIPDDRSVKEAIERQETSWNSKIIPKPPPFSPLFFGNRYQVSSNTQVKITPEPHLPFCYKSPEDQQLFVEIYIRKMAKEVEFFITDGQNDTEVWRASLRSGDISHSRNKSKKLSGAAFLKKHKTELCSRMGQLSSILLNLSVEDVINSEEEEEVQAQNTKQKKNQFLLELVEKKGLKAQEKLFQVLQTKDPFLVEDLEKATLTD